MRTFIAIPLPPETLRALAEMQSALRATRAQARWTDPDSIHLTLKFLGEVSPEVAAALGAALKSRLLFHRRFSLRAEGLGAFPSPSAPRVVWCGVSGDVSELMGIQSAVESACESLGFEPEERAFHPHLTLGRVKGKRNLRALTECIKIGSDRGGEFLACEVNVYRSTLTPSGALYDVLDSIVLQS